MEKNFEVLLYVEEFKENDLVLLKKWKRKKFDNKKLLYITLSVSDQFLFLFKLEILNSSRFRQGFLHWILVDGKKTKDSLCIVQSNEDQQDNIVVKVLANKEAKLSFSKEYLWWRLLHPLLVQKIQLEYMMACLSTLGGAHSSLGDVSKKHAERAGEISAQQYIVAIKLNDSVTKSRCKLFLAHSLMQRGRLKLASNIIRSEYNTAKVARSVSTLLITCCLAAWSKLKYLYTLKKENKARIAAR
ncbi:uncharacterized protein F58A4.6-like [Hydractinia symbiolongicarpus]|uniref:uncharacterized protein F58A4.6-like n=1 Tax=Hydractinia symbiolongicarpus TaxID=13093 RepID=UPI002549E2C0|nr:uncharacterized protein F58A4.6-like [Hydractinia symbiolongicarpus]